MVSKSEIKLITSLNQKKYRQKAGLFVVEGVKSVAEFLESAMEVHSVFATENYETPSKEVPITRIQDFELQKISHLKTPNEVLALFKIPDYKPLAYSGLILVLDHINDPGNLGTIIRLCDWFGVKNLVCSTESVDCFHPKVVQASMGSLARVNIYYADLQEFLKKSSLPIYFADLEGTSLYGMSVPQDAILVMGSEAHGISKPLYDLPHTAWTIPKYTENAPVESLNVATATALFLSECRR